MHKVLVVILASLWLAGCKGEKEECVFIPEVAAKINLQVEPLEDTLDRKSVV